MAKNPTYEELELKIKEAEQKAFEIKQTMVAFAQKNTALNSFMNNISDMVWVKDSDSRFIAVNKAFCEAVGMGMESLISHTCEVCFTKKEAEKFREDDLKVMEDRKQRIIEEKIIDSEKNEIWFETIKSPVLDESGKVIGTIGIARDISKRKQTEVELAYKTALLEAHSRTSIDGILVIDSDGKVVMSNEQMREMWNVPQKIWKLGDDNILLQHAITLLKDPDEFLEKVRYLYDHKDEKSRNEIELKDGRYFDRYSSPLTDSANKYHGRIWFFRDITNRKKAELELEKLNLELEERVVHRTAEISKAYTLLRQKMDELKQTEKELRESEERYKELFERSLDCVYIHDFEGNFIDVNQTALGLFGYTKKEITSLNFASILSEDELLKASNALRDIIEKGVQDGLIEYKVKKKNGDYFYVESTGALIYKDGKPYAVMGTARDITERKQMEEALRKSEERFKFLTENITDIVWTIDKNFRTTYVSPSIEKVLGYTPEERKRQSVEEQITPESLNRVMEKFQEELLRDKEQSADPERYVPIELEYYHEDGSVVWLENNVQAIRDKAGEIVEMYAVSRDITKRKQAEEALRKSEEKYRLIMASMNDAVYIVSNDSRIKYMNPRMIDRIGREAAGELCYKAVYDNDAKCSWCVFDQILQGECVEYELANPRDNRYYSISNSPFHHGDGNISKLTIFHDITEQKTIESQLRGAQKMEAVGTLAGGIAHEFNNILEIILGNAELAIEDVPEWNQAKNSLKEICTASLRARGVVQQILSFAQKTPSTRKPIKISSIIKESLKLIRATIPTTIEIRHEILCGSEMILATTTEINQILINLCSNSAHAMEKEIGILELKLETIILNNRSALQYEDLTAGAYVKLTVKDTGKGIDPKIVNRIFDPYFTTKDVDQGLGMGLAVVYGIVKNHYGAIKCMSKVGKGTTFEVLFPIIEGQTETNVEKSDHLPTGTEHILFVDDEKPIVDMTQKLLERLGYKVETKINPVEALELFQLKPSKFDLVITDMTMPQMTGVTLSKKLMDIRPDIPVIICTGHSSLINEEKAEEQGIAAYVTKPTAMSDLAKIIRKALDEAKRSTHG